MPALLLAALLCSPQTPPSLTANVNDTRSHGQLGDQFLSLDEAIQLANGTLPPVALSAAERAQLVGPGTMVDTIVVDAMATPVITLQAPLSDVSGMSGMGMGMLTIMGMPDGSGMAPVLEGGTVARVLALRTTMVQVMGFHVHAGQVGIEVHTASAGQAGNQMAMVTDCEFDAQTSSALVLRANAADQSAAMLQRLQLHDLPVGCRVDDQSAAGGFTMADTEWIDMDRVALGVDIVENGSGAMSMWMAFRSTFRNGGTYVRVRRGAGSAQQFMLRLTHCDVQGTGDLVDVQGTALGTTMVHHHHSDLLATAGHKALYTWPRTAEFDLHGSEMVFAGDVVLTGNLFTQRVWQQNNRYRDGTVTIDCDGSLPSLLWNHYENCTLTVPASARTAVTVRSSEFVNCPVSGQSALAPVTLDGCWRNASALSGQAAEVHPAPSAFLGTTSVTPLQPHVGTTFRLTADLPFGIGGLWDVTFADSRPNTATEPIRYYGDPFSAMVLPGMVVFHSAIDIPIPNLPVLVGIEFYCQGIAVPLLGQPWVPAFQLPRGGRLVPQA